MHPHVHVRSALSARRPALPTRVPPSEALASFADRSIRGEVMREFQEAARQHK